MQTQHKIERAASPNASQLHAIQTTECPLLIIAGPGSGKTFTLVERAFYLIAEKNVLPERILISTFTEKTDWEIIDFKSEAKPDALDVLSYQRYQKQLETYAHIVEERHGLNVSQMHLYYTGEGNGNPLISFEKINAISIKPCRSLRQLFGGLSVKIFGLGSGPMKRVCRGCDLMFYCDL